MAESDCYQTFVSPCLGEVAAGAGTTFPSCPCTRCGHMTVLTNGV